MRGWTTMLLLAACLVGCSAPPLSQPPPASPVDLAAHRRAHEALVSQFELGPNIAGRHLTRHLSTADERVLREVQSGRVHQVQDLAFERAGDFDELGHAPSDAVAYVLVDPEDRTVRPVGWHDRETGDVIELSTGYRLRVLDKPGTSTRIGEHGEQFFTYGFGWYPRWNRILPAPIIEQLDAFYTTGIAHVKKKLEQFREVAKPSHSGGDLRLITWDDALLRRMADWGNKLPAAPYVHLPDAGKVDIRPERFARAIADKRVVVEPASLESYREAERTVVNFAGREGGVPSEQAIKDVLLAPFHKPELFSLVDRAILLDAVFEGDAPLTLIIDPDVGGGFFVPDDGEKEVHVAYTEVDLNFRYNGLIFAKLAHEAHHVVEFRQRPFLTRRCWYQRDDVIETLKYLNEFMWWVQHYPGDAPNWDWAPINAGIVLASLLEGYFPNSRC